MFKKIDEFNRLLGLAASWCAIAMMLFQGFSVVARYVFSYGIISVQEAVVYGHALIFMGGAAFLLQLNQHVRVDVFYDMISPAKRKRIDIIALVFFVIPVVCLIGWTAYPYVARSWQVLEGSRQAGGLPAIFLLKTSILVFAVSVLLQALVTLSRILSPDGDEHWSNDRKEGSH